MRPQLDWLAEQGVLRGCSLITSLPDVSELDGKSLPSWKTWFVSAAEAVLRAALRESTLEPVTAPETATRRAITISPASGGEVTLRAAGARAPRAVPA